MEKILENIQLLEALRKGDERAFEKVFRAYFPRLCQFAKTYINDWAVSKNMAQDAFLRLWENRASLRDGGSVIAYLLTLTRNCCLDYLKHLQVELKHSHSVTKNFSETELNYQALKRLEIDLLDYSEIQQIIDTTLQSLPPQCKQVFSMSRFENLSNTEISEKLEISVKAVEANITRALKIFRVELKDYIAILVLLNIPIK